MATRFRRFTLSDQAVGGCSWCRSSLRRFFLWLSDRRGGWMAFFSYNPLDPTCLPSSACPTSLTSSTTSCSGLPFGKRPFGQGFSIVFQTLFGVAIALLLHQALPGIAIFRGLLLFPYIVPTVVIALIWRWIFNPEIGVVNYALLASGVISERIYWLSTPEMAMASTIMLNVWKYTPFVVICVLARLQSVPARTLRRREGRRSRRDPPLRRRRRCLSSRKFLSWSWCSGRFGRSTNLRRSIFSRRAARAHLHVQPRSLRLRAVDRQPEARSAAATGVIMMIMLSVGSVIYLRSAGFAREEGHG